MDRGGHAHSRLKLTVKPNRQTYLLRDEMELESRLTNLGNEDIYLFDDLCCRFADGLTLWVYDSTGKEVPRASDFLPDCLPPPPKRGDMSRFVRLPAGHFYGHTTSFKIQEFVKEPGEYDFVSEYHSFISAKFLAESGFPDVPFWTSDKEPLKCRVHLKIAP